MADSPYRVQVMQVSKMKPADVAQDGRETSSTPTSTETPPNTGATPTSPAASQTDLRPSPTRSPEWPSSSTPSIQPVPTPETDTPSSEPRMTATDDAQTTPDMLPDEALPTVGPLAAARETVATRAEPTPRTMPAPLEQAAARVTAVPPPVMEPTAPARQATPSSPLSQSPIPTAPSDSDKLIRTVWTEKKPLQEAIAQSTPTPSTDNTRAAERAIPQAPVTEPTAPEELSRSALRIEPMRSQQQSEPARPLQEGQPTQPNVPAQQTQQESVTDPTWSQRGDTPTPPRAPAPQPSDTTRTSMLVRQTPPQTPTTADHSQGMNLAALRERMLHETGHAPVHSDVQADLKSPDIQAQAAARKAKLAGTDTQVLQAHLKDLPTAREAIAANMMDAMRVPSSDANAPTTEHAAAIAGIAGNLDKLRAGDNSTAGAPEGAPQHSSIPAMRTFRNDVEQTVMHNQTSVVSALAAEETRRSSKDASRIQGHQKSMLSPGAYLMLGMSITLLIGGAIGVGAYLFITQQNTVIPEESLPSFIFLEDDEQIDITDKSRSDIMDQLAYYRDQVNVRIGAITGLYLTERAATQDGQTAYRLLGAQTLFERLETDAPPSMIRNLEPLYLFGIHEFDGNQPFFIFKTQQFELVFSGMLEWEQSMNLDLYPLFGDIVTAPASTVPATAPDALATSSTATTSATSSAVVTAPVNESFPTGSQRVAAFKDIVVSNTEARVLRDREGKSVLVWAFLDANTLVLATNEFTLREIRERLTARTF